MSRFNGVCSVLLLTAFLFGFAPPRSAEAGAIYSHGSAHLVRVTWHEEDATVSINYCERASDQDFEGFNCVWLGGRESYTLKELQSHQKRVLASAQKLIAIDIAIICTATAAGFLGGYLAGWAIFGKVAVQTLFIAQAGGAVGMGGAAIPIKISDKLNPSKRYKNVRRLDGVFLTEQKNILVEDVDKEALALEQILTDLDANSVSTR